MSTTSRYRRASQDPAYRRAPRNSQTSYSGYESPEDHRRDITPNSAPRWQEQSDDWRYKRDLGSETPRTSGSTFAFRGAPSLAPHESVSQVSEREGQGGPGYSVVESSRPRRPKYRSRASSDDGTSWSGPALTQKNLRALGSGPPARRRSTHQTAARRSKYESRSRSRRRSGSRNDSRRRKESRSRHDSVSRTDRYAGQKGHEGRQDYVEVYELPPCESPPSSVFYSHASRRDARRQSRAEDVYDLPPDDSPPSSVFYTETKTSRRDSRRDSRAGREQYRDDIQPSPAVPPPPSVHTVRTGTIQRQSAAPSRRSRSMADRQSHAKYCEEDRSFITSPHAPSIPQSTHESRAARSTRQRSLAGSRRSQQRSQFNADESVFSPPQKETSRTEVVAAGAAAGAAGLWAARSRAATTSQYEGRPQDQRTAVSTRQVSPHPYSNAEEQALTTTKSVGTEVARTVATNRDIDAVSSRSRPSPPPELDYASTPSSGSSDTVHPEEAWEKRVYIREYVRPTDGMLIRDRECIIRKLRPSSAMPPLTAPA